jgi:hypothetical protein
MKIKHKYNQTLESFLITLDEEEFLQWLQTNEIEYNRTLLEAILVEVSNDNTSKEFSTY